ncbi:unnamed protein product [Schistocephalus solidus]|uniref:Uncharacterized protein n=1 Tax=Schistocephalus solidus TaxID=70667 RepID=A0A183SD20_SCHSO|nr:unnamed protein product [Schistocephalus solidus]
MEQPPGERNPQHPCHAEASATAMERPPGKGILSIHAMLRQVQLRWSGHLVRMDDERCHAMLRQVQLRWSGHLVRMDDERLPKDFFYGDVATGARRQGGRKRRFKDTLKKSLKQLKINLVNREDLAQERLA